MPLDEKDLTLNLGGIDPTIEGLGDPTLGRLEAPIAPEEIPEETLAPEPEEDPAEPQGGEAPPLLAAEQEEAEARPFFDLADVPKALVTGAEGFVRDAYGFLDFLSFDSLPDVSGKPTSFKLNSTVGEFLSEAVNFGLGFIPAAGVLGKVGKIGNAINLTTKAERVALRASKIAQIAGRADDATSLGRRALGIRWGRDFTAGAAVDFAFLDSQEERLTTILNAAPQLDPLIPDFLADKTDDNQFRERLLNVMEGGIMGVALDSLFLGAKALKKARAARAAGKSPEAVQRELIRDQEEMLDAVAPGRHDTAALQSDRPAVAPDPEATPSRFLFDADEATLPGAVEDVRGLIPEDAAADVLEPVVSKRARLYETGEVGGKEGSRRNLKLRQNVVEQIGRTPETTTLVDSLDEAMRDKFGMAVRSVSEEAGADYYTRIGVLAARAIETGRFGSEEVQNLVFAVRERLTPKQLDSLNELLQAERDALVLKEKDLRPLLGPKGQFRDITRRDLWETGRFTEAEIDRLGDAVDRISNPDRLLSHLILRPEEATPAALADVVLHGRRVFNAVADGFEAKFGASRAQAVFNLDRLNTSNIVPGGNIRASDMAALARAELDDSTFLGQFANDIGADNPETLAAVARVDRDLRVNPRNLSAADRTIRNLDDRALNLKKFLTTNGFVRLLRSMERLYQGFDEAPVPWDADFTRAHEQLQNLVDPAKPDHWNVELFGSADALRDESQRSRAQFLAARHVLIVMGERVKGGLERFKAGEFRAGPEGADQLAELVLEVKRLNQVREFVSQWGTEAGRRLKLVDSPPTAAAQTGVADDLLRRSGLSDDEIAGIRASEAADVAKRRQGREAQGTSLFEEGELTDTQVTDQIIRDEAQQALAEVGGVTGAERLLTDLSGIVAGQGGDITGLVRAARVMNGPQGGREMIAELWYNSMLSSGRTFMVNLMGSLGYTMLRPIEIGLGAAFAGDTKSLVRAKNELIGLFTNLRESWKYGRAVFKEGQSRLVGGAVPVQEGLFKSGAISTSNESLSALRGSFMGQLVDGLGTIVRLPTRGLMATDEAIKQLQFRSTLMSDTAHRLTIEEGLAPEQAWEVAGDLLERHVRDGQAFSAKALYDKGYQLAVESGVPEGFADQQAKQYVKDNFRHLRSTVRDFQGLNQRAVDTAKQVTFTQDLPREGFFSVPSHIATMANSNWLVRIAVPFVRTPSNLLFTTGQHFDVLSPLRYYTTKALKGDEVFRETAARRSKFIQDMVSGDPARAAEARGRLAVGLSAFVTVGMAYANGFITGGGPLDPKKNEAWRQTGWQPYSLRTPDGHFFSYERFDPIANLLGIAADFFEVQNLSPDVDDTELEKFGSAIAVAVASNLDNKTYLSGLTDFLGAIGDPRQSATNVFARIGGSIVPTILSDVARAQDPYEREARTFVEKIQKRLPGMRSELPIMRNMLGEPVNRAMTAAHAVVDGPGAEVLGMWTPIAYSSTTSRVLDNELRELHYGFAPPSPRMGGLDLREYESPTHGTVYDRYASLISEVEIGGKTLRDSLEELVQAEGYQRLSNVSTEDSPSPRISLIQQRINRYRRAAKRALQREHPEIRQEMVDRVKLKRRRLLGRDIGGL